MFWFWKIKQIEWKVKSPLLWNVLLTINIDVAYFVSSRFGILFVIYQAMQFSANNGLNENVLFTDPHCRIFFIAVCCVFVLKGMVFKNHCILKYQTHIQELCYHCSICLRRSTLQPWLTLDSRNLNKKQKSYLERSS